MNPNIKVKVLTNPTVKRQHDGGETWRFTAITDDNKIAHFTCRGYSISNTITKDHFYVVSNMTTTAYGDKLTVNIGPKSKVLHVAFPTVAILPLFVRN